MNGFTNAFLSLLLGWLRSAFNAVWALLSSDRSGVLVRFLRENWQFVFLVMCVGGFAVDRIVYLVRWRPFAVRRARREARRRDAEASRRDRYAGEDEAPAARYHAPEDYAPGPYDAPTARYASATAGAVTRTYGVSGARLQPDTRPSAAFAPRNVQPLPENGPPSWDDVPVYAPEDEALQPDDWRRPWDAPSGYGEPALPGNRADAYPAWNRPPVYAPTGYNAPADPSWATYEDEYPVAGEAPGRASTAAYAPPAQSDAYRGGQPNAYHSSQPDAYRAGQQGYVPQRAAGLSSISSVPFSPDARFAPTATYAPIPYHEPPDTEPFIDEPRYDEDLDCAYGLPDRFVSGAAAGYSEPSLAAGMTPVFGTSQPEPYHELQELRTAATPRPAPAEPFAPRPEPATPEPVHPGLDLETFHQNIGLTNQDTLTDSRRETGEAYPDFVPYPEATPQDTLARPRGLSALAKKARSLVSGEDERNPLSIRDLQSTVDVKSAFHAPVYPKKSAESEEEE